LHEIKYIKNEEIELCTIKVDYFSKICCLHSSPSLIWLDQSYTFHHKQQLLLISNISHLLIFAFQQLLFSSLELHIRLKFSDHWIYPKFGHGRCNTFSTLRKTGSEDFLALINFLSSQTYHMTHLKIDANRQNYFYLPKMFQETLEREIHWVKRRHFRLWWVYWD
jgi:hypothetical protein